VAHNLNDLPRAIAYNKAEMNFWLKEAAKVLPTHDVYQRRMDRAEAHRMRIIELEKRDTLLYGK
jgi:hypothetical protein